MNEATKETVAYIDGLLRKRIDLLSKRGNLVSKITDHSQAKDYLDALDLASDESEVATEIISTLMDVIAKLTHKLGASGVN